MGNAILEILDISLIFISRQVLGKGVLPKQPVIVKARWVIDLEREN